MKEIMPPPGPFERFETNLGGGPEQPNPNHPLNCEDTFDLNGPVWKAKRAKEIRQNKADLLQRGPDIFII